ncbi:MAG: hypothetical protein GY754_01290 [bacterium]|nr:hypothetical protein [bacterium]
MTGTREKTDQDNEPKEEVNLLRKRTFNVELRQLVGRISNNEGQNPEDEVVPEEPLSHEPGLLDESPEFLEKDIRNIDSLSADELLLKFHQLFYKVKQLDKIKDINPSFNPFEIDQKGRDFEEALIDYIRIEMKAISFPAFAILSYSMEQKCYRPIFNSLKGINTENITISLRDGIYQHIEKNPYGYVLEESMIENNVYLKKKFLSSREQSKNSLYLLHVNKTTTNLHSELNSGQLEDSFSIFPSPIMIIQLEKEGEFNRERAFRLLEERFSVPFFILAEYENAGFGQGGFDDFDNIVLFFDYAFEISKWINNEIGILIQTTKYHNKEVLLLMRYMYTKLSVLIPSDSFVIRVTKERFIVLTKNSMVELVRDMVEEFNTFFGHTFDLNTFSINDINRLEALLPLRNR